MKRKVSGRKKRENAQEAEEQFDGQQLKARLDAIVALLCSLKFSDNDGKLAQAPVAKLLHRAGYTPTEIALFFGKKKATDVSSYLY
jgi:hypothetical protein